MTPITPSATTQAEDWPIPANVSSILPVKAMRTTQTTALAVFAAAYSNAACSRASISMWYVNHPPLDTAMQARASDDRRVPAVGDVARPMDSKKLNAKTKETPMMSLKARDAEMLYVLVSQQ